MQVGVGLLVDWGGGMDLVGVEEDWRKSDVGLI